MLRHGYSDPAAVIPDTIYTKWAVSLAGPMPPLAISHPDDVRRVLQDKGEYFGRNRQMQTLLRRAWGKGLAAVEGEEWARQRQAAAPVFRPQAVEGMAGAMADSVRRVALGWDTAAPITLDAAIGRIVAEVVLTTLLTGLVDVDVDQLATDTPHFVRLVSTFGALDMLPLPDRLLDWLRGLGRSPHERRLRAIVGQLADARADGPDLVQDFPATMRGAGPLVDNILGTLPAGFETTVRAVGWAIYLIARYPEWQEAIRAEALAADTSGTTEVGALPLTRLVAQESMRLYPPAPLLVRTATQQTTIQGHPIRKGQVIVIAVYAMHRHQRLWERPGGFDPARFAPSATYSRHAFIPFGTGSRMCVAAQFAMTEMTVILAELLKLYRFTPTDSLPDVSLIISTHARNGLWVRAERL